jgi:hypothetical protein
MSRSNNSRKGKNKSRGHNKHHNCCEPHCPYCHKNFVVAELKQKLKGAEENVRLSSNKSKLKYPNALPDED